MGEFRDAVLRFDHRMDGLDLKIDRFREELAGRIDGLSHRIDGLDLKVDRFREELAGRVDRVDVRLDSMDHKISRQFLWLVGVQITVLLAVLGVLLRP
jgi:hypothetical protein